MIAGFPTGFENIGGCAVHWGGVVVMGGGWVQLKYMGELKMVLKNTCVEVHVLVKLLAISWQAYKFTKIELLHIYFSRVLARF